MDTPPAYSPQPIDHRIVLLVTSGPYAGLRQINGTVAQLKALVGELPEYVEVTSMPPDDRPAPCSLVTYKPRYVLYKECSGPITKRFSEQQR